MSTRVEELISTRVDSLPEGLRQHTYRVQRIATDLAHHHNVDHEKARLGALAHDIARSMKGEQLLRMARELDIDVRPVEESMPILLHGPVGAELLRRNEGVDDPDIYEAVYWHSTSHTGLGPTAKVVFLADKLDPHKAARYPYQGELRDLANLSLDKAMTKFLNREIIALLQAGSLVHPASVEALNELTLTARGSTASEP